MLGLTHFGRFLLRGLQYLSPGVAESAEDRESVYRPVLDPCSLEPWTRRRSVQVGLVWPKPNKSSRRPSLGSRRASARSGIGVSVRSRVVRWLVWVPGMRFDRPGAPCCPDHRFIVVTAREPRRAYIPAREPQQAIRQGTHDKIPCTLRWVRKRRS